MCVVCLRVLIGISERMCASVCYGFYDGGPALFGCCNCCMILAPGLFFESGSLASWHLEWML